jgi:hypothetical protein
VQAMMTPWILLLLLRLLLLLLQSLHFAAAL